MSVFRELPLTVVKKDSVVSVVSEVEHRSECSEIVHFISSEVKQCSERSQRYSYNSSEVKQCREFSR